MHLNLPKPSRAEPSLEYARVRVRLKTEPESENGCFREDELGCIRAGCQRERGRHAEFIAANGVVVGKSVSLLLKWDKARQAVEDRSRRRNAPRRVIAWVICRRECVTIGLIEFTAPTHRRQPVPRNYPFRCRIFPVVPSRSRSRSSSSSAPVAISTGPADECH